MNETVGEATVTTEGQEDEKKKEVMELGSMCVEDRIDVIDRADMDVRGW